MTNELKNSEAIISSVSASLGLADILWPKFMIVLQDARDQEEVKESEGQGSRQIKLPSGECSLDGQKQTPNLIRLVMNKLN